MSMGLIALLDDVAGIAKVAAASVDDLIGQAARAGVKSAGVVIDDAAVAPRYVVGFAAERELPIVVKIARGSLWNKLVILLPAALALSLLAPWTITPLLMAGGLFLSYEGAEKIYEAFFPHEAHAHEEKVGAAPAEPHALEDAKVKSAIRTDFILSAEIMAITLSAIDSDVFWIRAVVLAIVGAGITLLVYGAVAIIVKADDVGLAMAKGERLSRFGGLSRAVGRGLVRGMPGFLKALALVGTAAMIWVGGGIVSHGLAKFGWHGPEHAVEGVATALAGETGFAHWLVGATGYGVIGLALGFALIPITARVLAPGFAALKARFS